MFLNVFVFICVEEGRYYYIGLVIGDDSDIIVYDRSRRELAVCLMHHST